MAITKICRTCLTEKDVESFGRHAQRYDGKLTTCKDCMNLKKNPDKQALADKKYRETHAEQFKASRKAWGLKNPRRLKSNNLRKKYGITIEQYDEMFTQQNGYCKVCKKHQSEFNSPLNVDHCHKTKLVRGLLCGNCNKLLGLAKENPQTCKNAAKYLESFINV